MADKREIARLSLPSWVWWSIASFFIISALIIYLYIETAKLNTLNNINYIVLVLAAFVGSPFFIWRTILTSKQTEIQQESEHTKNYFEAIQQLDFEASKYDEKITSRAGTIYGLGNIAKNSQDHHLQIVKLLVSYIQKNTKKEKPLKPDKTDIIAALEVIGNRNEKWIEEIEDKENYQLDFSDLDFSEIQLPPNMNFAKIVFNEANLKNANFQSANLRGADLLNTDLEFVKFDWANLCGAILFSARNLTQEQIDSTFGDGATYLPAGLHKPPHWLTIILSEKRSKEEWEKWKENSIFYNPPTK